MVPSSDVRPFASCHTPSYVLPFLRIKLLMVLIFHLDARTHTLTQAFPSSRPLRRRQCYRIITLVRKSYAKSSVKFRSIHSRGLQYSNQILKASILSLKKYCLNENPRVIAVEALYCDLLDI